MDPEHMRNSEKRIQHLGGYRGATTKRANLSVPSFAELPEWSEVEDGTIAHVGDSDTHWRAMPGGWAPVQQFTPEQVEQLRQVIREELDRDD